MMLTRKVSVSAAILLAACFDSDQLHSNNTDIGTDGSDTVTMYNDETTASSDDSWTAEETGPGESTCRDAIECMVMCQTQFILNMEPEPNLMCFIDCDAGLTTDEAYNLFKLGECIGNKCATEDPDGPNGPKPIACGPEGTEYDCLLCIATYGSDPQPVGCLEEAAACG